MTYLKMYWLMVAMNAHHSLVAIIALSLAVSLSSLLFFTLAYDEMSKRHVKHLKSLFKCGIIIFTISAILSFFTPTSSQVATIYIVPTVANSKLAKDVPEYIHKFIQLWIKKMEDQANDTKN